VQASDLQTPEAAAANANKVIAALRALKIDMGLNAQSIAEGSSVDLLLLALHLYQVG
jgi:hypothetical protein